MQLSLSNSRLIYKGKFGFMIYFVSGLFFLIWVLVGPLLNNKAWFILLLFICSICCLNIVDFIWFSKILFVVELDINCKLLFVSNFFLDIITFLFML